MFSVMADELTFIRHFLSVLTFYVFIKSAYRIRKEGKYKHNDLRRVERTITDFGGISSSRRV